MIQKRQQGHQYYPAHWAGLDCASFVQRVINETDPRIDATIRDLPGIRVHVMDLADSLDQYRLTCGIDNAGQRGINNPRAWVEYYFQNAETRTHYSEIPRTPAQEGERVRKIRLLHKGDLLQYPRSGGVSHVSMVYSENAECADSNNSASCRYEIVHAYGSNTYFDRLIAQNVFSRKVIRTLNDLPSRGGGILQPTGFGRIKLWD